MAEVEAGLGKGRGMVELKSEEGSKGDESSLRGNALGWGDGDLGEFMATDVGMRFDCRGDACLFTYRESSSAALAN